MGITSWYGRSVESPKCDHTIKSTKSQIKSIDSQTNDITTDGTLMSALSQLSQMEENMTQISHAITEISNQKKSIMSQEDLVNLITKQSKKSMKNMFSFMCDRLQLNQTPKNNAIVSMDTDIDSNSPNVTIMNPNARTPFQESRGRSWSPVEHETL